MRHRPLVVRGDGPPPADAGRRGRRGCLAPTAQPERSRERASWSRRARRPPREHADRGEPQVEPQALAPRDDGRAEQGHDEAPHDVLGRTRVERPVSRLVPGSAGEAPGWVGLASVLLTIRCCRGRRRSTVEDEVLAHDGRLVRHGAVDAEACSRPEAPSTRQSASPALTDREAAASGREDHSTSPMPLRSATSTVSRGRRFGEVDRAAHAVVAALARDRGRVGNEPTPCQRLTFTGRRSTSEATETGTESTRARTAKPPSTPGAAHEARDDPDAEDHRGRPESCQSTGPVNGPASSRPAKVMRTGPAHREEAGAAPSTGGLGRGARAARAAHCPPPPLPGGGPGSGRCHGHGRARGRAAGRVRGRRRAVGRGGGAGPDWRAALTTIAITTPTTSQIR